MMQEVRNHRASSVVLIALMVTLLCVPLEAGLRGPGKYSGVVFFDRWDTCVLVSSVYVMYIAEELKGDFRPFSGQAIEIDANNVFQPQNPGDGLIRKYKGIAPAPKPHRVITLDGLALNAYRDVERGPTAVTIEVLNKGTRTAKVYTNEIGINVFSSRKPGLSPSDGLSEAVLTRTPLTGPEFYQAPFETTEKVPRTVMVKPEASYKVTLILRLSPGEYQFVFGYGGGVHEEASLLSNALLLDVAQ